MTRKVRRSAHCIQLIEPREIGRQAPEGIIRPLPDDDSSIDGDSSGDESASSQRLAELSGPPDPLSAYKQETRNRERRMRREDRQRQIDEHNNMTGKGRGGERRSDIIILEYMENGSLQGLIEKLSLERRRGRGRIPNRVLWSFWLCLIRACVGMEYPPRKFHPDRNQRPPPPPEPVLATATATRRLKRELARLVIRMPRSSPPPPLARAVDPLGEDLIENIPDGRNANRRQNLVHFDIDPQNILIGDLECTDGGRAWQRTRNGAEARAEFLLGEEPEVPGYGFKSLGLLEKRNDRVRCEHEFVPRLKVTDFGLADNIKRGKRNVYYFNRRTKGKVGGFAPEQFGHEWDSMPDRPDERQISRSQIQGYYGPHSNIWGIALSMWMLITKSEPPIPPQPQIPFDLDYDATNRTPREIDRDFRILDMNEPTSYCAWLLDPDTEFNWVDFDLRERIYQCMYHRPDDRPTLSALLREAETKLCNEAFPGESDDFVREWVHKCIYEPPTTTDSEESEVDDDDDAPPPGVPRPREPPPQPLIPPPSEAAAADRPEDAAQFHSDFPNGCVVITNSVDDEYSGAAALIDSITAQAPSLTNPTTGERISPPTLDDLRRIWRGGGQNRTFGELPYLTFELADTLRLWGRENGLTVNLGYLAQNGDHQRLHAGGQSDRIFWIWDDDGHHWEGVAPVRPRQSGSNGAQTGVSRLPSAPDVPTPSVPNLVSPLRIAPPAPGSHPRFVAAYNADFPGGAVQISNSAQVGQCGLLSIQDSLRAQLGPNPTTPAGAPIQLPTYNDLLQRYRALRAGGAFQALNQQINAQANQDPDAGPFQAEEIAMVLRDWGYQYGLLLDLGAALPNGRHYVVPQVVPGTQTIWVFNPGATWRGVRADPGFAQAEYDNRFPWGHWTRDGGRQVRPDQRGIAALWSGLYSQFRQGAELPGGRLPEESDLNLHFQRWLANGRDPVAGAASNNPPRVRPNAGPATPEEVAGALFTWARTVGMSLNLGVRTARGAAEPYIIFSGMPNSRTLWVQRSSDNTWVTVGPLGRPPPSVHSGDSLPDYSDIVSD
ncbi:hypothetical protein Hte_006295 [Hypoxylon texense]